jgi:hypothetical protein
VSAVVNPMDDAAGRGRACGAQDGHQAGRYARLARGSPNGRAGRRAGSRVARPTAGKRNRLVCERSDPTVGSNACVRRGRWYTVRSRSRPRRDRNAERRPEPKSIEAWETRRATRLTLMAALYAAPKAVQAIHEPIKLRQ